MSTETIKQQLSVLSKSEQTEILQFLIEQMKDTPSSAPLFPTGDQNENEQRLHRAQQMEWLKANREAFAGQYVALSENKLVGYGKTMRDAHEQARQNGVEAPILIRVTSEQEILSGGW
ncbi:MAG TPA: DUF5678 domain-containing protein [Acidobacteriota bacterium]|nr:DUF5678 domain-containing protein [Acidobacteriota bacterium]